MDGPSPLTTPPISVRQIRCMARRYETNMQQILQGMRDTYTYDLQQLQPPHRFAWGRRLTEVNSPVPITLTKIFTTSVIVNLPVRIVLELADTPLSATLTPLQLTRQLRQHATRYGGYTLELDQLPRIMRTIGKTLNRLRTEREMTRAIVAEQLDLRGKDIELVERHAETTSAEVFYRYTALLGITPVALIDMVTPNRTITPDLD